MSSLLKSWLTRDIDDFSFLFDDVMQKKKKTMDRNVLQKEEGGGEGLV